MEDSYEWKEAHPAGPERFHRLCLPGISLFAIVGLFLGLRPLDQSRAFHCNRDLVFNTFFVQVANLSQRFNRLICDLGLRYLRFLLFNFLLLL